jgi:release factor glutamine methyltransferase
MTVLEVIKRSSEYLEKRGVESPRLQIELLLAHVLKLPRLKLYLDFERRLSEHELDTVRTLVKRRGDREPLQYIIGVTSFCGIELEVSPAVLIPRPETELLVEQAWNFLGRCGKPDPGILDFGTGSGCIALAVAAKFPQAFVAAIDISESALAVARANAARNNARVNFHCAGDFAPAGQREFDLIVSNPPYIPTNELNSLQPEVRDHEPRLALDGGADGLEFHRLIARESPSHLADGGKLMVELGFGQAQAAEEVYVKEGWRVESVLPDYSGCARILIAHR